MCRLSIVLVVKRPNPESSVFIVDFLQVKFACSAQRTTNWLCR